MNIWFKFIIVLVVCITLVSTVYVLRFGFPKFENKEEKMLQNIVEYISNKLDEEKEETYVIKAERKGNVIYFRSEERTNTNNAEVLSFNFEKGIISSKLVQGQNKELFNKAVQCVFEAVAVYNGYSSENARYSLIYDIVKEKSFDVDGYQLNTINDVTRFMVSTNMKLNLANKEDVYIKVLDLENYKDILRNKLEYKIIEKPGIIFEKNLSYARNLNYVIYEKDGLTERTYKSLMTVLDVVIDNKATIDYVKNNYPVITRAGTLNLDGISISLNEGLGEGNIYSFDKPEDYEYMLIKINIDKHIS